MPAALRRIQPIAAMEANIATRKTVLREDDLEGGPADETLLFSLAGVDYEIDLSAKNAEALRGQLAAFADHARTVGAARRRRAAPVVSNRQRSAAVRAWAKQQGIELSERGRLPSLVVAQYQAATKGGPAKEAGAA